jgi:hypothetical protein
MSKSYIWGVFLHPDLRYFQLKYDSEIWHTGGGGQNRASEFFEGQDLFWWLQNGAPKEKLYTWIVSDWEDLQS